MLIFSCHVCKTPLSAQVSQAGQLVRCPTCLTTLRVPAATPAAPMPPPPLAQPAPKGATVEVEAGSFVQSPRTQAASSASSSMASSPTSSSSGTATATATPTIQRRVTLPSQFRAPGGGKHYGFNCGYCSSRLEATESMAGQEGQCPTCGNTIVIPILDRYGRLIDPMTGKIIKQDPHPVHAYAAAGERAPRILRQGNTTQVIQCPRCGSLSGITSNNCKSCGMPFTMEGTTIEAAGGGNGFCVSSLVLGIIGIPAGCTGIVPLLAIIFGAIGLNQVNKSGVEGGGRGMAIAGIICGVIGLMMFAYLVMH
jgi:DNA-directed RNA polymerase subunit RPC12/RpoP